MEAARFQRSGTAPGGRPGDYFECRGLFVVITFNGINKPRESGGRKTMMKPPSSSRHQPDSVPEELAAVLLAKTSADFDALFRAVYSRLLARNEAGEGEEKLRLRVREKLQVLVAQGLVRKNGDSYAGVRAVLRARPSQRAVAKVIAPQRHGSILHPE